MLHIILLILKIIGIIIAVILGLAVALLLIVLFVPIRYVIDAGCHDKKLKAHVKVTWIMHIFRGVISYDEELFYSIKALWFNIYSSDAESKKEKRHKKNTENNTKEKNTKNKHIDAIEDKADKAVSKDKKISSNIEISKDKKMSYGSSIKDKCTTVSDSDITGRELSSEKQDGVDKAGLEEADCIQKKLSLEKSHDEVKESDEKSTIEENGKLHTLVNKIKNVYYKIKAFIRRAIDTVKAALNKSQAAADTIKHKYTEIRNKVTDPENIEFVRFLWTQIKAVMNIIKPAKYNVNIRYGFEDSATTGWVAVRLAVLYGLMGMDVSIIPDFDNSIFEGDIYMKGRFNLYSFLIIGVRLYRNKSFRKLINR